MRPLDLRRVDEVERQYDYLGPRRLALLYDRRSPEERRIDEIRESLRMYRRMVMDSLHAARRNPAASERHLANAAWAREEHRWRLAELRDARANRGAMRCCIAF